MWRIEKGSNAIMTQSDVMRQKKMREKFSEFIEAFYEYNEYAKPIDQVKANSEISKLTEKIFKPCDTFEVNLNEDI